MKLESISLSAVLLSFIVLQSCQGTISSAIIPQVENKALLSNKALNRSIETYVDKYLSEIIRIRNFNPERVKKVFCVHHTVYVETAVKAPNTIHAYIKLLCVEATPSTPNEVSISNLKGLESKIHVQRYRQNRGERFQVISEETPRDMPFYLEDLRRIFPNDLIDRVRYARFDEKADYEVIRKKALEFYKNNSSDCQQ